MSQRVSYGVNEAAETAGIGLTKLREEGFVDVKEGFKDEGAPKAKEKKAASVKQ